MRAAKHGWDWCGWWGLLCLCPLQCLSVAEVNLYSWWTALLQSQLTGNFPVDVAVYNSRLGIQDRTLCVDADTGADRCCDTTSGFWTVMVWNLSGICCANTTMRQTLCWRNDGSPQTGPFVQCMKCSWFILPTSWCQGFQDWSPLENILAQVLALIETSLHAWQSFPDCFRMAGSIARGIHVCRVSDSKHFAGCVPNSSGQTNFDVVRNLRSFDFFDGKLQQFMCWNKVKFTKQSIGASINHTKVLQLSCPHPQAGGTSFKVPELLCVPAWYLLASYC